MTILIIEDNEQIQELCKMMLKGTGVKILQAITIKEANEVFMKHKDEIDIIYVDGCVPGNQINTVELTQNLRANFHGKMIAISSLDDYNVELLKAGCNHAVEKSGIPFHTLLETQNNI